MNGQIEQADEEANISLIASRQVPGSGSSGDTQTSYRVYSLEEQHRTLAPCQSEENEENERAGLVSLVPPSKYTE